MALDELDLRIIRELQADKHANTTELAQKLGISQPTISRRINRLRRNKIIRQIWIPDVKAMGYNGMAVIAINIDMNKIDDACRDLLKRESVDLIVHTFGSYNLLLAVYFPTVDLLTQFIREDLSNIDGITKVEVFYIADLIKMTFGWVSGKG